MHITIVPAGPKTARATIQNLLDDPSGPTVRAVYRDPSKAPASFLAHPRFSASKGDVASSESLDFSSSDAVLVITPPRFDGYDVGAHAREVSENTRRAVERAGSVKRVVLLSSMGAQYAEDVGEIKTNHQAEQVFRGAAREVVFVRPCYFMENWASVVGTASSEAAFFFSTVTPLDFQMPMVSVEDIGCTLAGELLSTGQELPASPYVFELHGPGLYSTLDVQKAFEEVLGKKLTVKAVEKADLDGFFGHVFPPATAKEFAEMNRSFLPGGIIDRDPNPTGVIKKGKIELVDAFKQLVAK